MNNVAGNLIPFLAILNPFALCLYLTAVMDDLESRAFFRVLLRASVISLVVFWVFALVGEPLLVTVLDLRTESLRIFGGIIFFIIGYNYVMRGYKAAEVLRGTLEDLPSAIALPYMIGAGTITQAILVGKKHSVQISMFILLLGIAVAFVLVVGFKVLRDHMTKRNKPVFNRYVNILSRINGLLIGAISTQMVVSGVRALWDSR